MKCTAPGSVTLKKKMAEKKTFETSFYFIKPRIRVSCSTVYRTHLYKELTLGGHSSYFKLNFLAS
jgi:hypothetical protein